MLERLAIETGHHVLEVGFGGGDLLVAALDAGAGQVTGVDISPDVVARARRRFAGRAGLTLREAQAIDLPLADESADRVASLHNIYFWKDPARAFAEFARVLRSGGRLVVGFEPAAQMRKWEGHRYGFRLWEGAEAAAMMRDAGFENVSHDIVRKAVDAAFVSGAKPARAPHHDQG